LAFGVVVLGAIAWGGLTAAAIATTPKAVEVAESDTAAPDWAQLPAQELAGIGLFRQENCAVCHGPSAGGTKIAPSLTSVGTRRNAAWMIAHFKRPQAMVPGSTMPAVNLPDAQLNALSAFLLKLTSKSAANLPAVPNFAAAGAMVYQKNNCGACHQVNGVGVKMGPGLNGVGRRRTKEWLQQHFVDPKKMSPGSVMPPYHFSPKEMEDITAYLMVLPQG
jgi:sulfur oxidation c-type cytochrome SoxX